MSDTSNTPGTFCWWELGTPSQDGAKQFYSALFGWGINDLPVGEGNVYTMFEVDGKSLGAAFTQPKAHQEQGIPPHWLSYVAVDDVDATAAKVAPAGGTVMAPPFDVMDVGRMAVATDPTGAAFAMWQAGKHHGADYKDGVGGVCWTELVTKSASAARSFYSNVFGWNVEDMPMGDFTYHIMKAGEATAGGMMEMTPEWDANIPSHWTPYFNVASADATAAKATEIGGSVLVPPSDIPNVGRFAVLEDPQGVKFSILQPAPQPA